MIPVKPHTATSSDESLSGVNDAQRHIAIYIYGPSGGGATRRTLTLAGGFAQRGHRVDLVVVDAEGPLAGELPEGVRLVVLDSALIRLAGRKRDAASRPAVLRWRATCGASVRTCCCRPPTTCI